MSRARPAVEVTGARELRRALRAMGEDIGDLKAIHAEAGGFVLDRAGAIVPRVSGALAGTIRLDRRSTGVAILAGRRSVPYAGPIHFGWNRRNITPQPFLYDALDSRRAEVVAAYSGRVEELVRRVGRDTR